MKKYWTIIKNEFQRQFAYRISIASFSLGNVLEIVAQIIIWTVIYQGVDEIRGYSQKEMMSYVVVGWFFLFVSSNYNFENYIARDIHQGTLSNLIIKPISYLKYIVVVSLGRIMVALFFVLFVQSVLIFSFLHSHIVLPSDPRVWIILIFMLLGSYFIKLFISILIGTISFWTIEINGIFFSLNVVSKFFSGAYFPINLLPALFINISLFFPFAYTFYVPLQLYLGRLSVGQGAKALGVELIWLFLLYGLTKLVWKKGLKKYESVGI